MLADDGLPGEDLAMKLGSALRRRLARFEGLPDEVAGVARTALQASYGVAEAGTVPGREPPSGDTERQLATAPPAGWRRNPAHPASGPATATGTHPVARPEGSTDVLKPALRRNQPVAGLQPRERGRPGRSDRQ